MQNKAAHLVTLTPVLEQLHWLPLEYRIQFKVIVMVFKCLHNEAPSYLCDSRLRSDSAIKLYKPIAGLQYYSTQIVEQFAHRSTQFKCFICF